MLGEPSLLWLCSPESRGVHLNLAHSVAVVNALATLRTLVVLEVRNYIRNPVMFIMPVPTDSFDFGTAAGRAFCDSNHRFNYKALLEEIRK